MARHAPGMRRCTTSLARMLGCALLVAAGAASPAPSRRRLLATTAAAACPTPSQLCAATPGANLLANPCSCTTFIQCSGAVGYLQNCSPGLLFNPARSYCDWPANVKASSAPFTPAPSPSPSPPSPPAANPLLPSGPLFVGYYETWSAAWAGTGAALDLARIPPYVNVVIVAFAQPDCSYTKGSLVLSGTGLQWSSTPAVARAAIAALKSANPNTRVLLAVGGATYINFARMNTQCIKDLVDDFGFDGVDLDYEPGNSACALLGGAVKCATDAESVAVTAALRDALPRGKYLLSTAAWHVGAYGQGAFMASQPMGSQYWGVNLAMARSAAGQQIDLVNIMAYDAGSATAPAGAPTGFNPLEAMRAHKAAWPNAAIATGVEVAPEAWGGNVLTSAAVQSVATYTRANGGAGVMLWSLHKKTGSPGPQAVAQQVCGIYGLAGCATPLPV